MKTTKKILIIILCILTMFLCGILWVGLRSGEPGFFIHRGEVINNNYTLAMESEVNSEGITSLNIQYGMNSNSVYFYEGEEENIVIREYLNFEPEEGQLSAVSKQDSELLIKGKQRNSISFISFGGSRNGYVEVYLPADFTASLAAVTVSGDVRSEREFVGADSFQISTTSGDLYFPKVEAEDIRFSSTSGDITLEQMAGESIKAATTSGDIMLGLAKGDVEASSTSGDIRILSGEGQRNVSTISGEIRVDEINGSFDLDTTSGDVSVMQGEGYGNVNTVSGDVRIFLTELQSNLAVGTTSGEVHIKLPEEGSYTLHFDSTSGEAKTFFDDELSYNKRGNQADGTYGSGESKIITVSTISGDLRITEAQ